MGKPNGVLEKPEPKAAHLAKIPPGSTRERGQRKAEALAKLARDRLTKNDGGRSMPRPLPLGDVGARPVGGEGTRRAVRQPEIRTGQTAMKKGPSRATHLDPRERRKRGGKHQKNPNHPSPGKGAKGPSLQQKNKKQPRQGPQTGKTPVLKKRPSREEHISTKGGI